MARQIEVNMGMVRPHRRPATKRVSAYKLSYRWRKEYGGLKPEQVKRTRELEKENTRLKRLVAELSLEK